MPPSKNKKDPAKHDKKYTIAKKHLADLPQGVPATPQERGYEECPCPGTKCSLRGLCLLCTAFHGRKGRLPFCEKQEKDG